MNESNQQTEVSMRVILIAAIGKNNELGRNNDLMWRLRSDMDFFKRATTGHWVIMGRKSWESLPAKYRPLPNRENVVITRDSSYTADGAHVFGNLQDALNAAKDAKATVAFIIGGGQIYSQALHSNRINELYLTHVEAAFSDADVFFPTIDNTMWNRQLLESFEADERNEYGGSIYHYRKK
ncbi:MAG: dihydrofolate reductase [Flavobacteriales bacterium]